MAEDRCFRRSGLLADLQATEPREATRWMPRRFSQADRFAIGNRYGALFTRNSPEGDDLQAA